MTAQARVSELKQQLAALTELGAYESEDAALAHALQTLLAARRDLRVAVGCRLYETGGFSLGRTAEWTDRSIEALKEMLHRRGISRRTEDDPERISAMACRALEAAGRSTA
ncbi:MAG: hypothetical protein GY842_02955 [bacterium]|nr:hypothetical protein [bacterium]